MSKVQTKLLTIAIIVLSSVVLALAVIIMIATVLDELHGRLEYSAFVQPLIMPVLVLSVLLPVAIFWRSRMDTSRSGPNSNRE
jgi:uncharacterized protein YqhQ